MIIYSARSTGGDARVALTPQAVEKLTRLGAGVEVEAGYGELLALADQEFERAGARVRPDPDEALAGADVVVGLMEPDLTTVTKVRRGAIWISFLDPFRQTGLVRALAEGSISSLCMELIPRTSYAQKMDALSSQASLAGYSAVIAAAERIKKALPMMTTPAGTIPPARVFIIGVGVAGLQAIATAKRLGARVEAYDTRPVVEEQVLSLGARFVKIDVGETGQTEQGYAKALTAEQLESQQQQMARHCANADIVITTAQVFGRPAPRIVTGEMLDGMRPGSVVVDLAASTGGNVEGSAADQEVVRPNGVTILGFGNLARQVAGDASQMYANNVYNLIEHAWDQETSSLRLDLEDTIIGGCLLTHEGQVLHQGVRERLESDS
ncbi:MAG: NAD(P) transhydrogenase subunit alpha [Truepera sp.]|nr:NAD(P) transhydrogenase subunit alpha [Truepera sp.]